MYFDGLQNTFCNPSTHQMNHRKQNTYFSIMACNEYEDTFLGKNTCFSTKTIERFRQKCVTSWAFWNLNWDMGGLRYSIYLQISANALQWSFAQQKTTMYKPRLPSGCLIDGRQRILAHSIWSHAYLALRWCWTCRLYYLSFRWSSIIPRGLWC